MSPLFFVETSIEGTGEFIEHLLRRPFADLLEPFKADPVVLVEDRRQQSGTA